MTNYSYKFAGSALNQSDADTIRNAWRKGNDAGEGYVPTLSNDEYVPDDYDDAAQAMYNDKGWQLVASTGSGDNISLWRDDAGHLIALADANGAWAVDVTGKIPTYIAK